MLRSQNSSSLLVTVSQFRHLVSLVRIPWDDVFTMSQESQICGHLEYLIDPSYRVLSVRVWCLGFGEVHTWAPCAAQLTNNNFIDVVDEEN